MSPPTPIDPFAVRLTVALGAKIPPVDSAPPDWIVTVPLAPPLSPAVVMSPPMVTGLPLTRSVPPLRGAPVPPVRSMPGESVTRPLALSVSDRPFVHPLSPTPATKHVAM